MPRRTLLHPEQGRNDADVDVTQRGRGIDVQRQEGLGDHGQGQILQNYFGRKQFGIIL